MGSVLTAPSAAVKKAANLTGLMNDDDRSLGVTNVRCSREMWSLHHHLNRFPARRRALHCIHAMAVPSP
jgi:hypothetical protein